VFSICNQVTYYVSSLGIGVSFQELKTEIIVKKYGYTCFVTRATAD